MIHWPEYRRYRWSNRALTERISASAGFDPSIPRSDTFSPD